MTLRQMTSQVVSQGEWRAVPRREDHEGVGIAAGKKCSREDEIGAWQGLLHEGVCQAQVSRVRWMVEAWQSQPHKSGNRWLEDLRMLEEAKRREVSGMWFPWLHEVEARKSRQHAEHEEDDEKVSQMPSTRRIRRLQIGSEPQVEEMRRQQKSEEEVEAAGKRKQKQEEVQAEKKQNSSTRRIIRLRSEDY